MPKRKALTSDFHQGAIELANMKADTLFWAILTISMVLIALFFGLIPKGWPVVNDAQWLTDQRAIRFQSTGIAYVDDMRAVRLKRQPWPLTIEMAVTANIDRRGFNPILVMHDGDDRRQLAIWQYGTSLIVMNGDDYSNKQRRPRLIGRNVFIPQQMIYITITSGEQGTKLYINGILSSTNSDWNLAIPVKGDPLRLVLGHSVYGKLGWSGDMHGLAVSGEAISDDSVLPRYERWAANHDFMALKQASTVLLFTFDEKAEHGFVDESGGNQDLKLPEKMIVLKKTFLSPAWPKLGWNRVVTGDIILNIFGFVPLGVVIYGFLQCFSWPLSGHKEMLALLCCFLLSFGIEFAQAWIPTRYSTLPDLMLNIFGAWIGIEALKLIRKMKTKRINVD